MKIIVIALLLILFSNGYAQIGIGTNNPDENAILELSAANKGFLLPRVELISINSAVPLSNHVMGMSVYNTATVADVMPGYYYNNGFKWLRIVTSEDASKWTNDAVEKKVFLTNRSDSTPRPIGTEIQISDTGNLGIGASSPKVKLDVNGYLKLASTDGTGDTALVPGMIRFNNTTNKFQGYVKDNDQIIVGDQPGWVDLN